MKSEKKLKDFLALSKSVTKKGEYGLCMFSDGLYFYKKPKSNGFSNEKYNMLLKAGYRVSKPIKVFKNGLEIYEYDEDLYANTLHDELYFKKTNMIKVYLWLRTLKRRCRSKTKNYLDNTCSKAFFHDRLEFIQKSLKEFSKSDGIYKWAYDSISNDISYVIKDYLKNKKLRTYISNGDLTDTNVCLNGKVCDFENAGENVILCDLATLYVSLIYGGWIYPRYNSGAYDFRRLRIGKGNPEVTKDRLFMIKYIKRIVSHVLREERLFDIFVMIRLLSPIDINDMCVKDQEKVKSILLKVYNNGCWDYTFDK